MRLALLARSLAPLLVPKRHCLIAVSQEHNVGRGISVVTDDLVRVMNNDHLWAACLDVMGRRVL